MNYKYILPLLIVAYLAVSASEQKSDKTECQIKRENAQKQIKDIEDAGKGSAMAIVVPNCTPEGDYATLQCHHGSNFCSCWDKEGIPMTQPKKNLKKCSCLMERAGELKRIPPSQMESAEVTSCELDGNYQAKQCNRTSCWCVNPETGKKLGEDNKDKNSVKC